MKMSKKNRECLQRVLEAHKDVFLNKQREHMRYVIPKMAKNLIYSASVVQLRVKNMSAESFKKEYRPVITPFMSLAIDIVKMAKIAVIINKIW